MGICFRQSVLLLVLVCSSLASQALTLETTTSQTPILQPLPSRLDDGASHKAAFWLNQDFHSALYGQAVQPSATGSWHKFSIDNTHPTIQSQVLNFDVHIIRHLDVYVFNNGTLQQHRALGIRDQHNVITSADYQGPTVHFDILPDHKIDILIYKQNHGPGIIPMTLYTQKAFNQHLKKQQFFWGAIIALLLSMAIYNALVYAMHPNQSYLWYLLFHSTCFFYFGALNGFGYLLWPAWLQSLLAQHIMTLNFLLIFLLVNFSSLFLNAKENAPKHIRFIKPISIISLLGVVASFWLPEYMLIPPFSLLQLAGTVFGISMGISAYKKRFKPALYFLISWVFTLSGGAIGMATVMNLLPINFFTLHGFLFGSILELFLLSMALASRMSYFEKALLTQAYLYPGTQVGNFSYLKQILPDNLSSILAEKQKPYLLVANLDGFKNIVALFGPKTLSESYYQHTERMQSFLRKKDWSIAMPLPTGSHVYLLALPGEQAMILVNAKTTTIENIIEQIKHYAEESMVIEKQNINIRMQLGFIQISPTDTVEDRYRKAQLAVINCIKHNENYLAYSDRFDHAINAHMQTLQQLRHAILNNQLTLFFQPKLALKTNTLQGAEALIRWPQADGSYIPPVQFIQIAEQAGLIFEITKLVIRQGCEWLAQLKQHQRTTYNQFTLSLNLSVLDLAHPQLMEYLQSHVLINDIESDKIMLEITESVFMENQQAFLQTLGKLKTLGFKLAIDDFGTGYSSMLYLKNIAAHEIKIDMAFIRGIDSNGVNQNIVTAIIQLARATGSVVTAEGVESQSEALWLASRTCDLAQGYLWSPAISGKDFTQRLASFAQSPQP